MLSKSHVYYGTCSHDENRFSSLVPRLRAPPGFVPETINRSRYCVLVNQGHGSQLETFSSIAVKDVQSWESLQRTIGEISVLSVALTSLQIVPSCFFQ